MGEKALEVSEVLEAAHALLEAASRTIFYDCSICEPDPNFGDGHDDLPIDGGFAPVKLGHFRRLRDAIDRLQGNVPAEDSKSRIGAR